MCFIEHRNNQNGRHHELRLCTWSKGKRVYVKSKLKLTDKELATLQTWLLLSAPFVLTFSAPYELWESFPDAYYLTAENKLMNPKYPSNDIDADWQTLIGYQDTSQSCLGRIGKVLFILILVFILGITQLPEGVEFAFSVPILIKAMLYGTIFFGLLIVLNVPIVGLVYLFAKLRQIDQRRKNDQS